MTKQEIIAHIRARAAAYETDAVAYAHRAYYAGFAPQAAMCRNKADVYKAQADALYSVALEIEDGLTDAELFGAD